MTSILDYQVNQLVIPFNARKSIEQLIVHQPVGQLIDLHCPSDKSPQLPKWKWALVFTNCEALARFIQEIDQSEEKQQKLAMDNYSVFANVMFVFMRRQMKLNIWASYVESIVAHKPLAIFIFNLRYKQLAAMIDSDTQVHYKIFWDQYFEIKKNSTKNQLFKNENNNDQTHPPNSQQDEEPEGRESTGSESYKNVKRKATKSSHNQREMKPTKKFIKQDKIKVKTEQSPQKEVIYLEEEDKHQLANKSTEESTKDHDKPRYKSLTEKIKLNSIDLLGKINDIAECLSKLIDSINSFQEHNC